MEGMSVPVLSNVLGHSGWRILFSWTRQGSKVVFIRRPCSTAMPSGDWARLYPDQSRGADLSSRPIRVPV
eukprot:scaffold878_cov271-Pinguiococcus_pyrenoidosus.AAC.61